MVFGGTCSNLYIGHNKISTTTGGLGTNVFWGVPLFDLNGATIEYNAIDRIAVNRVAVLA